MKRRITTLLVLGILPWADLYAQQQAQTTFTVKARVNALCEITANDLDFGPYSGTELQGSALLKATCTPGSSYQIGLNAGTGGGTIPGGRQMTSPGIGQKLTYQLYTDSTRNAIWGNTQGSDTVTGSGTGVAVDHTVYGKIAAKLAVPAGNYSDTITVTVYY